MQLVSFLCNLLGNNIPFVSYRLPNAPTPITLAGGFFSTDPRYASGDCFVVAPFDADQHAALKFYLPFFEVEGWSTEADFNGIDELITIPDLHGNKPVVADYASYSAQFASLMKKLKTGEFKKLVLSRIIETEMVEQTNPALLFEKLCSTYPSAFVYLFFDGHHELWLGASPETLLEVDAAKKAKTMSLAGTRVLDEKGIKGVEWTQKEMAEQLFVTDYIEGRLIQAGVENPGKGERFTSLAGNLAHLCTNFNYELPAQLTAIDLAMQLHPTPAVCGLPAMDAKRELLLTEPHERRLYSGFLGPVKNNGSAQLFVNLRCMQIIGKKAYLYAGGGLTIDSELEKEWEETKNKAETLLAVIQE
jgi:isochorismate synthase